jgi:hypothetical protein
LFSGTTNRGVETLLQFSSFNIINLYLFSFFFVVHSLMQGLPLFEFLDVDFVPCVASLCSLTFRMSLSKKTTKSNSNNKSTSHYPQPPPPTSGRRGYQPRATNSSNETSFGYSKLATHLNRPLEYFGGRSSPTDENHSIHFGKKHTLGRKEWNSSPPKLVCPCLISFPVFVPSYLT